MRYERGPGQRLSCRSERGDTASRVARARTYTLPVLVLYSYFGTGRYRAEGAVILCRAGGLQCSIKERGCGEEEGCGGALRRVRGEGAPPAPAPAALASPLTTLRKMQNLALTVAELQPRTPSCSFQTFSNGGMKIERLREIECKCQSRKSPLSACRARPTLEYFSRRCRNNVFLKRSTSKAPHTSPHGLGPDA